MEYILRKPTDQDVARIVELDRLSADHHHAVDPYWKKGADIGETSDIEKQVRDSLASEDEMWFVVESEGEVVGFFSAEIATTVPVFQNAKIGFVSDAHLLPEFRGKGIAKEAVSKFMEWFKERGVKSAELTVATHNIEGVRAWGGLGFQEYMKKMRIEL